MPEDEKKLAVFLFMSNAKNTRDVATERQHSLFLIAGLSCPQEQARDQFSLQKQTSQTSGGAVM